MFIRGQRDSIMNMNHFSMIKIDPRKPETIVGEIGAVEKGEYKPIIFKLKGFRDKTESAKAYKKLCSKLVEKVGLIEI